ncbi:hypothetical protein SCHPADRAFT_856337 [Schizopora paradoxa]|uniref:1-phosphatidylinositol 4-kinase n=1 Tax=Schizopora paradoxa TaxID=27342 RepID=A0A0H2RMI6_9AGAM|nr:hypothetical protein SCHPADRAFT_856337 [Schizopora paradoxa]
MSHALLLRLLLSPSFFSINVALQYLSLYHNHIGISYYITRRLKDYDINELRDVWGFICHLLLTRTSKSRALECFVVEVSERSSHMAILTLWFMQAHLKDIASKPINSDTFSVCQRVMQRCHELIFSDASELSTGPYSSMKIKSRSQQNRKRVRSHLEPALVGIGCILGARGRPDIASVVGEIAVEQGRIPLNNDSQRSIERAENGGPMFGRTISDEPASETDTPNDDHEVDRSDSPSSHLPTASLDVELVKDKDLLKSILKSRRGSGDSKSAILASLPELLNVRRSEASEDPLGQRDSIFNARSPSQSSPIVSNVGRVSTTGSGNVLDDFLQEYPPDIQRSLLQSHYCRSEVQFVLALENIANRLLVVPRPARVSALRAELTSLNHKLPAEVCVPLWCPGYDSVQDKTRKTVPHHRIVRIPPGESVVLNSADRAPFLLVIEILHDDLDFDPVKRHNKDILKDLVKNKLRSARTSREAFASSSLEINGVHQEWGAEEGTAEPNADEDIAGGNEGNVSADATEPNGEEEVDLVEQMYGGDLSVHRTPDLSDSLVVPSPLKNRAIDVAAWSRSNSMPPSPVLTPTNSDSPMQRTKSSLGRIYTSSDDPTSSNPSKARMPVLSLDEYSERMRTAAVMLTQLNASLLRDNSTVTPSAISGPLGLPITQQADDPTSGPVHPSLSGKGKPSRSMFSGQARPKLASTEVEAIRSRIMQEMIALEEERMGRMQMSESEQIMDFESGHGSFKNAEDEQIIRKELSRVDPSSIVVQESWVGKKSRIRQSSPYGHLASWDCVSVIVKTGADLRQEQLAVQMIREFEHIWRDAKCPAYVRPFQIVITGGSSGLVETITDAVSIHSIKKTLYAKRLTEGRFGQVTLLDHFINSFGDPSSAKFARAQRNFARSLAGYSVVSYLMQIKDRHNGNILLDRDGHLIHIDFGFMLSNSPGNIGFEAAPFKLTFDYVEVLGGTDSEAFLEFKRLFHEAFETARKHSDRIISIVELMQRDSALPCFAALGEQTAQQLRDRFQPKSNAQSASEFAERLIVSSLGSNWTRLYDSYQYYSQSIL